jgi:hypothetical protein
LLKTRNSAPSLNTMYTAESAQFYSLFLPTTIGLPLHCPRKWKVWLHFFAENAQNDPKTHSYEDNAKFHSVFLVTTLSYATRFQRKLGVSKNFKYPAEFEEDFWKCWLYCVLYLLVVWRCKKRGDSNKWKVRLCLWPSFTNNMEGGRDKFHRNHIHNLIIN